MAKAGSILVASFAVILGLFFGFVGVTFLMENDSFASGQSESRQFLIFGESSSGAEVPTAPWIGVLFLVFGAAVLLFGLRALFVAFEGKRAE